LKFKNPFVCAACLTLLMLGGPVPGVFTEAAAAVPHTETATFALG